MKQSWRILAPLICIAVTLGIFRSVLFVGYVPSESMEPTLKQGSIIFGVRFYWDIQVGDIIVFPHDRKLLVKRVAALGGDTVSVNGKYIEVPESCYYVLGDNADNSYDSRFWPDPFVKDRDIIAKVLQ